MAGGEGNKAYASDEQLLALVAEGRSNAEIAALLGYSGRQSVAVKLRRMGVVRSIDGARLGSVRKGGQVRKVSDKDLVRLDMRGFSAMRMSRELGVGPENVSRRLDLIPVFDRERLEAEIRAESGGSAETVPDMPGHPFWTPERDAVVLKCGGTWRGLRDAAEYLAVPTRRVEARWQLLRSR